MTDTVGHKKEVTVYNLLIYLINYHLGIYTDTITIFSIEVMMRVEISS